MHILDLCDYLTSPRGDRVARMTWDVIPGCGSVHTAVDLYDISHVGGWEPRGLRDLGHVYWGWICGFADPTQHLTTAG